MKDISIVAKGAGITLAGFMVSKVFAYIYSIFVARTLGPNDFGVFTLALGVLGFVMMFASLGLPAGIMRYVAFYRSKGEEAKVKGTILGGLAITIVSSLVFSVLLFFSADYIGVTVYNEPMLALALKLLSVIVPLGTVTSSILLAIEGFKRIKYKVYVRNFVENISKISLYGVFFIFGLRLMGVVFAFMLSYAISLLVSFYFLEKKVFPLIKTSIKSDYDFRQLLNFSWPLLAATFFTLLLGTIDGFMLGYFVDASAVGIYKVAETVARLLFLAYNSFGALAVPIATGYFALGKKKEMAVFFKAVTRWIFAFSMPLLLFILIFSQPLIVLFYGGDYASGHIPLMLLSLGFFVIVAVGPTQSLLHAIGRPRLDLLNTVVGVVVNVALNWLLIPLYGMAGAAIASAVAYIVWNLMSLVEVYLVAGVHPYSKSYLKPLFASLASAFVVMVLARTLVIDSLLLLFIVGMAFLLLYFLLLLFLKGFEKQDIEVIKLIEAKAGLKLPFIRNILKRFI